MDGWQRCPAGTAYLAPIGKPCAYRTLPGQEWDCCWLVGMDDSIISIPEPTVVLAEPNRSIIGGSGAVRGKYAVRRPFRDSELD